MSRRKATPEEQGAFAKRANRLFAKFSDGTVPTAETLKGLQDLSEGEPFVSENAFLRKGGMEVVPRVILADHEVDNDQSIENILKGVSAKLGYFDPRIADKYLYSTARSGLTVVSLALSKIGVDGLKENILEEIKGLGRTGITLAELIRFVPYRDILLDYGVKTIIAPATLFHAVHGSVLPVGLGLEGVPTLGLYTGLMNSASGYWVGQILTIPESL